MIDFSTDKLYESLSTRPHVCILGAGATMAAIPNGDFYGNKSSVMNHFIENLGLTEILKKAPITTSSTNFEDIYSEMDARSDCFLYKNVLEDRVINYFGNLRIPETPTVYDYLVASLRSKDYIFSFNWDPLLIQAHRRVSEITDDLPLLVFLHGNVGMKICSKCNQLQSVENSHCCECGCKVFNAPKILFPIKNKDYTSSPYIKTAWKALLNVISSCTYLTVFGYSAPKSDSNAVEAMQLAFDSNFRKFDRIEIIDTAPKDVVYDSWSHFFHSTNDHYNIVDSFWDSSFVEFPRRTIEGYCKRNIKGWWGSSNLQLHQCETFEEFKLMFQPIIEEDNKGNFDTL